MRPAEEIKKLIENLSDTTSPRMDRRVREDMLHALAESEATPTLAWSNIRRQIMKNPITKLAAAAVIITAVGLSIAVIDKVTSPAYALEQTVEALRNVRFLHVIGRDDQGRIKDERWIEIGMDGFQVRYRQDSPPNPFAIEDGESTAVYRHNKQAVIIYDRKDVQYQWVGELGKALENLRQQGKILKENDIYKGQGAHRVWWPYMSAECYVDPQTKLPIAIGDTELSYEEPPAGTFDIVIPEGYVAVDKRPGAPAGSVPDWLLEEESIQQKAADCFRQATHALARGDYSEAAELFEFVTQHQSGRNWAWFWLGSAYYGQGQYELAIEKFTKVLEIFKAYGGGGEKPLNYCNYARGLAYARLGMNEAAQADLQASLPSMILTLRTPSGGKMFEYADNPLMRYGKYDPSERQMVVNMINRLRTVTGQSFGYDPAATGQENEAAISAWERWSKDSGRVKFTPDAERVLLPESPE
ncbi:MAG: tetratricopeptide repeat protein [Phycisphaerales bacterium]|nr:MAG: tetratricopeptide repeat protein [Phycisphaerales bacterium]